MVFKSLSFVLLIAPFCGLATAQDWEEEASTAFPGHRVIGNLYAVGTRDLAVFLITSEEGHILINTGFADSTNIIRNNVESLGISFTEIRLLLQMQAHYDHTGALAEIKELTGAELWATEGDRDILEDGGQSDPHFQGRLPFAPVAVDKVLRHGEIVAVGEVRLEVHEHSGHSRGSSSYSMQVSEGGKAYSVVIANMGTINPGKRLVVDPTYPGIADDFARTFQRQKAMDVDVWVAAHGSQYGLHEKFTPGQEYSPETFVDPDGFLQAVEALEKIYLEQLNVEQAGSSLLP